MSLRRRMDLAQSLQHIINTDSNGVTWDSYADLITYGDSIKPYKFKSKEEYMADKEIRVVTEPHGKVFVEKVPDMGEVSDGYHTFNELYEHRHVLFLAFVNLYKDAVAPRTQCRAYFKTRRNKEGEAWPGWFIVGIKTQDGQITYHLPDKYWDLAHVPEIERNYDYDGHSSKDVLQRLHALLVPESGK